MSTPSRILLVRTGALGDVVHSLPAVAALRRGLPEARLAWLVEERHAPLLEDLPGLDAVLPVRLDAWRRRPLHPGTWSQVAGAARRLRRFRPEVAIDLMGNHKAGVLAVLSGAPVRIGFARRFRREPSSAVWINRPVVPEGRHAVDRALSLVAAVGGAPEPPDFGAGALLARAPQVARELLAADPGPWVLIHPGAGWGNKRYPAHWWGEVAGELGRVHGIEVRVASGPGEAGLGEAVERASGGRAAHLHAPSLYFLAAVLRRARLVLAGDTGPLHLAHALGAPVLAVMGPTDPAVTGPFRAPERALWHRLPCSFCHRRFDSPKACLLSIPPELVVERALKLLATEN